MTVKDANLEERVCLWDLDHEVQGHEVCQC